MGEKAWNSVMVNTFGWWWPHSCPTPHCLLIKSLSFAGGARPGEIHASDSGQDGQHSGHDGVFAGWLVATTPGSIWSALISDGESKPSTDCFFYAQTCPMVYRYTGNHKRSCLKTPLRLSNGLQQVLGILGWILQSLCHHPDWSEVVWTYPIPNLRSSRSFLVCNFTVWQFNL